MTPLKRKCSVTIQLKESAGTITEKVPICRVTFSVTGLIPLLFTPRVKESFRSNLGFAISSLAKNEAKGIYGVMATEKGKRPAATGEPRTGVRAPLAPML